MCRKQYSITRQDVQRHTARVCQQYIPLKDHGTKTTAAVLWAVLCYACARLTSLAAACSALRDAPSDTAAHTALMATLPHIVKLQQCINRALQGDLPKGLRQRKQPLSIDLTLNPYHGQPLHSADAIYRSQAKHGTTHFHAYATAYVTRKGQRYTLALTYVRKGQSLKEVVQELLRQAARCGVRPRYLLLDKGFGSVEVIRYLQRGRYPFLMPLVRRGRKADHPKGPSASQVFATWKKSGWGRYTLTSGKNKKERATVHVCVKCRNLRGERGKHGREALVYAFGGGLAPGSFPWVQETYRQRLGIETSYRQRREARLKTCTRDPLLRLLYVGLALILRNVWVWLHGQVLSPPRRGGRRLDLAQLSFCGMLLWLQHYAEAWLGTVDEIEAPRPFPT